MQDHRVTEGESGLRVLAAPLVVLALALAATVAAWRWESASAARQVRGELDDRLADVAARLRSRMLDDEQLLRGGAGLFAASNAVTRDEWRRYVAALRVEESFPGIQGIGFSRWIPAAALPAHERAVRAEGFPDYAVRPSGAREAYTSIVWLEPFDWRNQRAFGFDMFSEPVRRAAMERARDTGEAALTAKVVLVQETETDRQAGVLLYVPVFRSGAAATTRAERRASLEGFVYSPIRMRNFVLGALGRIPGDVAFEIFASEGPDPAARLFASDELAPLPAQADGAGLETQVRFAVNGSPWLVRMRAPPAFAARIEGRVPRGVLAGGLLVSLLLAGVTLAVSLGRARALAMSGALREGEARYRTFFERGPDGVMILDPDTTAILEFNDRACEQLGYAREELAGLRVRDFAVSTAGADDDVKRDLRRDGRTAFDAVHRRRDGTHRNVAVVLQVLRVGGRSVILAIHRDVTEQRRAEAERHRQEELLRARVELQLVALDGTLEDLFVKTLDALEGLTGSCIGFYHVVRDDERTIQLHAWSTRTAREFCKAEGKGTHYPVAQAGVWADALRLRRPVVHNDYPNLPGKRGLPAGHAVILREVSVPVVRRDKVVALLGVGNKATDYTPEDVAVAQRFADLAWEVAERKMMQDRLRESEARFAAAFERAPIIMSLSRLEDGTYLDVNQRFLEVLGFSREEVIGRTSVDLRVFSAEGRRKIVEELTEKGRIAGVESELRTRDGRPLTLKLWGEAIQVGGVRTLLSIAQDITLERSLQSQLAQAQRLEAVGRLAGGVAHDFNNMLSVILGNVDLVLEGAKLEGESRADLEEVRDAARRAAEVTRQLLAFARKQVVEAKVVSLEEGVAGVLRMLRRLIGEEIEIAWVPGPALPRVRVDPAQLDQVLANLCVNARDAIAGPGRIAIRAMAVHLDAADCDRLQGLEPGAYVRLTVEDDGSGIPPEVLPHLFEPFFTTKGMGRGTGLGLATVYGIARQAGGAAEAENLPGRGAAIHVYFPAAVGDLSPAPAAQPGRPATRGTGTVLLVEDEPAVLRLCGGLLRHLGYRVLTASGPAEAERVAAESPDIDLLVTDVIMPGGSGVDLAAALRARAPGLRCLFMSGYAGDALDRHALEGEAFIQKPFAAEALAGKVAEVLAAEPGAKA